MTEPPVHTHQLTERDLRSLANAVVRVSALQPRYIVFLVVELVVAVIMFADGLWVFGVVVLVLLALTLLSVYGQRVQAGRQLAADGLRPGTVVATQYLDDRVVVVVNGHPVTRPYSEIAGVRVLPGVVAVRIHGAKLPMLLPDAVVPDEARRRLAAAN